MVALIIIANVSSAEIIRGIDIDFVTIGNAGNAPDTQVMVNDGSTGYGAVDYNYRIGKYEVTVGQWNQFTTLAGAPTGNIVNGYNPYDEGADYSGVNLPVNRLSAHEIMQFCNYLTSGDKSQGAYQWTGDDTNPGDYLGIDRVLAISTYGVAYVMPTEDEWYKAAYYKPDGSGYSLYANGTDTPPISGVESNYGDAYPGVWDVGSGLEEQNSTFDMMGNIWECLESANMNITVQIRGSSTGGHDYYLSSAYRDGLKAFLEYDVGGFRVASIPEPATLSLIAFGGLALLRRRKA